MPAKTLDFTRTVFSDGQQLSSSTHFLSPETTLPFYDEIHFQNNQVSTQVEFFFLKCSAAVLSFYYLGGNLEYLNLVFCFRHNQRFS